MRNMAFTLTESGILARIKTVTRRPGWRSLKPGDRIRAVDKSQGLPIGAHPRELAILEVVSIRREALSAITAEDVVLEGFPHFTREDFIEHFCEQMMYLPDWPVTRIEFKYVEKE